MATEYFSTEDSLEATARSIQLFQWFDRNKDDILDADVLESGYKFAKGKILAYIIPRYGDQVNDWDSDTVPDFLQSMSDILVLYRGGSTSNNAAVGEILAANRQIVVDDLTAIRNEEISIPGVSDYSSTSTDVDSMETAFETEDGEPIITL